MSREWKPGDVALVRLATRSKAEPAIFDGDVWTVRKGATADPIEEPRPLVVIDPEDDDQVCRLVDALRANGWTSASGFSDTPAALRSLITPPKPKEPTGLGAVVEDSSGDLWIRRSGTKSPWISDAGNSFPVDWKHVDAVKVLSEGVTP